MGFFDKIKETFHSDVDQHLDDEAHEEYVELDTEHADAHSKTTVRPFTITDFEDIKEIVDALRGGTTIALVNIKPLKDKDLVELKRAIAKLKKTCDALDGEIAGFGEDYIVATPKFATIYRTKTMKDVPAEQAPQEQGPPSQL